MLMSHEERVLGRRELVWDNRFCSYCARVDLSPVLIMFFLQGFFWFELKIANMLRFSHHSA